MYPSFTSSKLFVLIVLLTFASALVIDREVEAARDSVSIQSGPSFSHTCQQDAGAGPCKLVEGGRNPVEALEESRGLENSIELEDGEEFVMLDGAMRITAEEGGGGSEEDSLAPNLPPSSRRRRWGLSLGLVALVSIGCLLWAYRKSLPTHRLPSIPRLSVNMPTISSSTFSLSKPQSSSFRPAPGSLLHWSEEEDPSNPVPTSSWRDKFPRISRSTTKYGRSRGSTRWGGLFRGQPQEGEGDYEEVGLLPSPTPYPLSARSAGTTTYGTV